MESTGKYHSTLEYGLHKIRRHAMRMALRTIAPRWRADQPLTPGYTAVIGVRHDLLGILETNLSFLHDTDTTNLVETIVVVDDTESGPVRQRLDAMAERFPALRLRTIFYSPRQRRVSRKLDTPWVYCWLSWAIGLAATRSRHVLLHDLDALVLDPDILDRRYRLVRDEGLHFLGDDYYSTNGIRPDDRLLTTWEMVVDVDHLRRHHSLIDLASAVGRLGDRRVDFDITLRAQLGDDRRRHEGIDRDRFVHPSQVIHQYTQFRRAKGVHPVPPPATILFVPYFLSVSEGGQVLTSAIDAPGPNGERTCRFMDGSIALPPLAAEHVEWMGTQMAKVDQHRFGHVRPELREYLDTITSLTA